MRPVTPGRGLQVMKRSRNHITFKLLSGLNDLFELVFACNKNTNPRYALACKIPNDTLRILDVCTGTANGLLLLAKRNPKNEITGIDVSSDVIEIAEKKVHKRKIKNISFHQMDATRIAFRDEQFDIVMISFGLHGLSYDCMIKAIQEMRRVLKRKGHFYIVDYEKQDKMLKNSILSVFLRIFESSHISQFLNYNWKEILRHAGLHTIEIENYLFSKLISAVKNQQRHPL
ncbi:MAG: class I SAM-dependent methyltransferase [bacterium]